MRTGITIAAMALMLAACGGGEDETMNAGGAGPSAEAAAGAATPAATPPAEASAPTYTLAGNGLEPGLAFGMKQEDAIKVATAAFGPGSKPEHNDDCGEGPMDFVSFGKLSLGFQEGKLAGWSLYETEPALRTKTGLTVGLPRSALGGIEIDEESTLGPEFVSEGVGGTLDRKGEKIEALWAGLPCQFR